MGMIKSDQELAVSKKMAKELRETRVSLKNVNPAFHDAMMMGPQALANDIEHEIKEYEMIKMGKIPKHYFKIENLGLLLIVLRIKNGLTQTELADKLQISQSQVSRDENNDYHGVTLPTVLKILNALNENLDLKLLK